MAPNDFSILSLSLHPTNCDLYSVNSTETDHPSPLLFNQRPQRSFRAAMPPGGRQINTALRSSLLGQVSKIQEASGGVKSFSLTHVAQEENQRLRDFSANYVQGGGGFARTQVSELDAIDREIKTLKMSMPSFKETPDARSRVMFVSAAATTIQVANIIVEGVVESVATGGAAVCSFTPLTQRGCDNVVGSASSLALAAQELANSAWDGSSAQRVFHSTAESIADCWQQYVESSDRALRREGLTSVQIEQYNKDLAIIGHGAGTLVLTAATGAVGAKVVTNVKQSMQFIKANVVSTQTLPRRLLSMPMPNPAASSWTGVGQDHFLNRGITHRTKMLPEDVGIPMSEYVKHRRPFIMPADYDLSGWLTPKKDVFKVTLENIRVPEGRLSNWLTVMSNFKTIASVNNASILRFEAEIVNKKLLEIMIKRYGEPTLVFKKRRGETVRYHSFDIPLSTSAKRLVHRITKEHMIAGEKFTLSRSTLARKPIEKTSGLADHINKFYSECVEHLLVGRKIGPNSGYIRHSLLSHISDNHMRFYIKKRHSDIGLRKRGIDPIHQSSRLTPQEQLEFILQEAYRIAQNTNGVTRVSFAWNSNKHAVASTLTKNGHEFVGRGSFSLGASEEPIELIEVLLRKLEP